GLDARVVPRELEVPGLVLREPALAVLPRLALPDRDRSDEPRLRHPLDDIRRRIPPREIQPHAAHVRLPRVRVRIVRRVALPDPVDDRVVELPEPLLLLVRAARAVQRRTPRSDPRVDDAPPRPHPRMP